MRGLTLIACVALLALVPAVPSSYWAAEDPRLAAILQPVELLELSASSEGILTRVNVDLGDVVTVGQVLAELESSVEHANVELARVRAESDASVRIAATELELSRLRHDQRLGLRDKGILSAENFEELKADLKIREATLTRARVNHEIEKLEYERAKALLERRIVRSPIDGVVIERRLSPGELISNSGVPVVLLVADLDPLIVDVQVPVNMLGSIEVGSSAKLIIEHPQAQYRTATVKVVGPVADAASATFNIRLELPNSDGVLPSGLRCSVRFED